jgi:2-methylisocitrate lyase-like PEP mutase family enzyme
MNQNEKAKRFTELHMKGAPLLLYNAWDVGSAKSILEAGAPAIATSSWSVAEAQGYRDGEAIPIELAEQIIGRIAPTIDIPVTVDFEGGYSEDDGELAYNIARLLGLSVIGINFEDRVVKGTGLYDIDRQARRIAAIRSVAENKAVGFFINARTDLFLGQGRDAAHSVGEALDRANAYAAAGASGFFIPGLRDAALIGRICDGATLLVNVMVMDGRDKAPQRNDQFACQRDDHGLARATTAISGAGAIPHCQRALLLKHQKPPGELDHAAADPGVAGSGEPLFAALRAALIRRAG